MRISALFLLTLVAGCGDAGSTYAVATDGGAGEAGFAGEAGGSGFAGAGGTAGDGSGGSAGSAAGAAGAPGGAAGDSGAAGAGSGGTGSTAGTGGSAGGAAGSGGQCTTPTCNPYFCDWDPEKMQQGLVPCCVTECGPCGYRTNTGTPSDVCQPG